MTGLTSSDSIGMRFLEKGQFDQQVETVRAY